MTKIPARSTSAQLRSWARPACPWSATGLLVSVLSLSPLACSDTSYTDSNGVPGAPGPFDRPNPYRPRGTGGTDDGSAGTLGAGTGGAAGTPGSGGMSGAGGTFSFGTAGIGGSLGIDAAGASAIDSDPFGDAVTGSAADYP